MKKITRDLNCDAILKCDIGIAGECKGAFFDKLVNIEKKVSSFCLFVC